MTIGRILHEQPADNLAEANDKDLDKYILKIQYVILDTFISRVEIQKKRKQINKNK